MGTSQTLVADNRMEVGLNVPVYRVNDNQAKEAYEAYQSLLHLQSLRPHLAHNEYFAALKDTAFARFQAAFEAL